MNDLEQRLKDMLDAEASKAPTVQRAPERLRPKVRRRQTGTALVGSLTVLAVVAVSVAGFRALDRTGPNDAPLPADDPWAGHQVFERTAAVQNFTIKSPSNWYLVDQWPLTSTLAQRSGQAACTGTAQAVPVGASGTDGASGPGGEDCNASEPIEGSVEIIPVLRLSNVDPGLELPICSFGGDEAAPSGNAAVLQVSVERATYPSGDLQEWPVELDETTPITNGPCGEGRYARFVIGSVSYIAWLGLGPDASREAEAQALATFASMTIGGRLQDASGTGTASYIIAGGENAAGPWVLELRPSSTETPSSNVELRLASPESFVMQGGTRAGDFTVPDVPIEQAGGDPVFGAVTKEAASVVLRQESRFSPIPAHLIPLPPSLPFDFDLFIARNEMDAPAKAVALGPNGEQLGTDGDPLPSDDVVTIEGTDPDAWSLKLSGSLADGDPCIDFDLKRADFVPLCPGDLPTDEPLIRIWSASGRLFAVGTAPPRSLGVHFEGPGSDIDGVRVNGPSGWNGIGGFVLPLLSLDDGSIVFTTSVGSRSVTLDHATRQLPWNNEGSTIAATGDFLGSSWRVEQLFYRDGLRVDAGGRIQSIEQPSVDKPVVLSLPDLSYGALVLVLTDPSVDEIDVTSEGRWYGRWMPSSTRDGEEARLWVVEVPGAGSGALNYEEKNVASVSWP